MPLSVLFPEVKEQPYRMEGCMAEGGKGYSVFKLFFDWLVGLRGWFVLFCIFVCSELHAVAQTGLNPQVSCSSFPRVGIVKVYTPSCSVEKHCSRIISTP